MLAWAQKFPSRATASSTFHPAIGERWEITQSVADSSGEVFEGIVWLDPRLPRPPPLIHPSSEETTGVPAGAPHTFRNRSDQPVKFSARLRPAGRAEEFFRHMVALIREGKIKRLPPKEPRSAIYATMLFVSYPDVSRPAGPLNAVFKAVALVGKAFRFKL